MFDSVTPTEPALLSYGGYVVRNIGVSDLFLGLTSTPPEVLAKNFAVPAQTFAKIPLHNLWIFQGTLPGDLASYQVAVSNKDRARPTTSLYFPTWIVGSNERIQRR
jgi:hypothetical protein